MAVAQIDGYVTDPSGQAVAGAQVKATEVDRDQVHLATTDATGRYQFPNLPAGNYQLEVGYLRVPSSSTLGSLRFRNLHGQP